MRPDDPAEADSKTPEIVIITGMSGAGRSTAAKSLEDLDWFVADNLPPDLLPTMLDLARRALGAVPRIAAVVDVRSRAFSTDLKSVVGDLEAAGARPYVVFLEASDDTLVRRFESVRRPHPLQEGGRVVDGIAAERELLEGVRGEADLVLDSSRLNVHELRARMRDTFGGDSDTALADEKQALEIFPNYSEANRLLAKFSCALKRWQDCYDAAVASANLVPYPETLGYEEDAQRALGRIGDAVTAKACCHGRHDWVARRFWRRHWCPPAPSRRCGCAKNVNRAESPSIIRDQSSAGMEMAQDLNPGSCTETL